MIFGYIKFAEDKKNFDTQVEAMSHYNCDKIFFERNDEMKCGTAWEILCSQLNSGDIVIVWKIDQLATAAWDLLRLVSKLYSKNVTFISTSEGIDTSTSVGRIRFRLNSILVHNRKNILANPNRLKSNKR